MLQGRDSWASNTAGTLHHDPYQGGTIKVQVTFEVSDNERIAIGVAQSGEFTPASRLLCKDFIEGLVGSELNVLSDVVETQKYEVARAIKESLGERAQQATATIDTLEPSTS